MTHDKNFITGLFTLSFIVGFSFLSFSPLQAQEEPNPWEVIQEEEQFLYLKTALEYVNFFEEVEDPEEVMEEGTAATVFPTNEAFQKAIEDEDNEMHAYGVIAEKIINEEELTAEEDFTFSWFSFLLPYFIIEEHSSEITNDPMTYETMSMGETTDDFKHTLTFYQEDEQIIIEDTLGTRGEVQSVIDIDVGTLYAVDTFLIGSEELESALVPGQEVTEEEVTEEEESAEEEILEDPESGVRVIQGRVTETNHAQNSFSLEDENRESYTVEYSENASIPTVDGLEEIPLTEVSSDYQIQIFGDVNKEENTIDAAEMMVTSIPEEISEEENTQEETSPEEEEEPEQNNEEEELDDEETLEATGRFLVLPVILGMGGIAIATKLYRK